MENYFEIRNPPALGQPRGWNHGMLAPAEGRILFVAGQTGTEPDKRNPADSEEQADTEESAVGKKPAAKRQTATSEFVEQFAVALDRVLAVVRDAGGEAGHIGRMTIFVTNIDAYLESRTDVGKAYRARMGRHYPAMALVEVGRLVDAGAVVEIEATAVLPKRQATERGADPC